MKRIKPPLPEWTRTIWANTAIQKEWTHKVQAVVNAWIQVERLSVVEGAREGCLTSVSPDELPEFVRWAATAGLVALPVKQIKNSGRSYSAETQPAVAGEPWTYKVALTVPKNVERWWEATNGKTYNNDEIGNLLGFPSCCRVFFERYWQDEQFKDLVWPMVGMPDTKTVELKNKEWYVKCNTLLHWLGVRLTPHLPCSFTCEASKDLAQQMFDVGVDTGYGEEMLWTEEMLGWPAEWSILHGIAEIKTPLLKISTRSDTTADRYTVRLYSDQYPKGAPYGTEFPYKQREKPLVSLTTRHKRQFEEAGKRKPGPDPEENGFSSREVMEECHQTFLDILQKHWKAPAYPKVLDLGCGNGELLDRIKVLFSGKSFGVEADKKRADSAKIHYPVGTFWHQNITDLHPWGDREYDLILMYPGRLHEISPEDRKKVHEKLVSITNTLLIYSYTGDERPKRVAELYVEELEKEKWQVQGKLREGSVIAILCTKEEE
jgi:hypothetical protein